MSRYDATEALAELKDFQRATVDHVVDRFYGLEATRRFLVADETGLGKSLVARGVIARTLEHLQDDDSVERVDVIYVCSNQDIAAQNLARLRVTPGEPINLSTRLTMLAKHSVALDGMAAEAGKPINLVALTPGTSFDRGWRTGTAEERAMLFLLLGRANNWDGWRRRAAVRALQATTRTPDQFERDIARLDAQLAGKIDKRIAADFLQLAEESGVLAGFDRLLDEIGRRAFLPNSLRDASYEVIGDLRAALARAGVRVLEPDLIILDEFQRFRHLLDEGGESAELARHLFEYGSARILLLSATPYKPFTLAEEVAAGDDHHRDFRRLLSFLCDDPRWNNDVTNTFAAYREGLVRGLPTGTARERLRSLLLRVMCRTERPTAAQNNMLLERVHIADELLTDDVRGYTALRRVADAVGAPVTLEYWKSAPYFLNFTEGYQVGDKLRSAAREGSLDLVPLLRGAQLLDRETLGRYDAVDLGNSRLRRLAANTVERGWWQLLWVPPSMPYHEFGEPFAIVAAEGMTKQLLFSSWTATPTAVAGLLSYEAERRIVEGTLRRNDPAERRRVATRLDYRVDAGRPAAMSTLALFWPHPRLAATCDPRVTAQRHSETLPALSEVHEAVRAAIVEKAPEDLRMAEHVGETHAWEALFRWPGAFPPGGLAAVDLTDVLTGRGGDEQDTTGTSGLRRHVDLAISVAAESRRPAARAPGDVSDDLALLGLHGPGNVAWRAFCRLLEPNSSVTAAGHWTAAAVLASGLRSLFNRMESTLILDRLALDTVYWRSVLRYAAAGGLQAVLDEYLHHLRGAMGELRLNDAALRRIADKAASALALRPSDYRAFDPAEPDNPIRLLSRFALRYGGRRNDVDDARQPEVRNAFNSPFWPFVLATTSVGQEGIDFHWWCSTVVHWNTPANPVDFEQREGRVHRFGGHAVRRNVSAVHRAAALKAPGADVWANAYAAARHESGDLLGDFAPYWVYPGEAKIERHLMPYPLSRDLRRLEKLRDDLVVYRLAFGQPRQEDMLNLLRRNGVTADVVEAHALCLRPDGPGHRHAPPTVELSPAHRHDCKAV